LVIIAQSRLAMRLSSAIATTMHGVFSSIRVSHESSQYIFRSLAPMTDRVKVIYSIGNPQQLDNANRCVRWPYLLP